MTTAIRTLLVLATVACGTDRRGPPPAPAARDAAPAPQLGSGASTGWTPPKVVWPAPQPPGPAYFLDSDEVWMVAVDGHASQLLSGVTSLAYASGGDVLALRGQNAIGITRISGSRLTSVPSPPVRGLFVFADSAGDRILVAASPGGDKPNSDPSTTVFEHGTWSRPETVAGVGVVTGAMIGEGGDLWVSGYHGIARQHAGTWKTWTCPSHADCIYSALAQRAHQPVVLIAESGHRWHTWYLDGHDELTADMPTGVDWASNRIGANGMLVEADDNSLRAHVGNATTSVTTEWNIGWNGTADGAGRYWYTTNHGLAITDLQHETSVLYPSGGPLIAGAAAPQTIVVIGSGPSLPPPSAVKLAAKVSGAITVNGHKLASTSFKICSEMSEGGDPCRHSKPLFDGKTDASGRFEVENVPAGAYDVALYLRTSKGNATWAVVGHALDVRSGATYRAGTINAFVYEYTSY